MRTDLFLAYATLPQLRTARLSAGEGTELAAAIDRRIAELLAVHGVTEAPTAQLNPNWTPDERILAQPRLTPPHALRIDPVSRSIWESGAPDNAFTGLVHLPTRTIHLVALKPARRSTPFPIGGITGYRATPVVHNVGGSGGQVPSTVDQATDQAQERARTVAERIAAGPSRPPTGTASHTQLAEIVGVPQAECVGFSVFQGEDGRVKSFNWTSRSSNSSQFFVTNLLGKKEGTSQVSRSWAAAIMETLNRDFGAAPAPEPASAPPLASAPPPPPPPPPV
ncbi:hypothetical protein [Kitasatospora sp. NPDC057738]|uniref:hypothetical protein n=1 Tax=Kitasatospora sp. NPDC057738 TaxID=3346233 RepID=UPI0036D13B52